MGLLREMVRRLRTFWHAPGHWRFRPDTIDRRIFLHVVADNEYRLPATLPSGSLVLDIGAHTGSFALAALRRGAGRVVCCEPCPDNFALLRHNLGPFGKRAVLLNCAVWRSDEPAQRLRLVNPVGPGNTGAMQARPDAAGPEADAVPFDDLISELTVGGRRLRLVKLDCEGAEWPVLFTSRRLELVDEMCGEYHLPPLAGPCPGLPVPSVEALQARLNELGFAAQITPCERSKLPVGTFFAKRQARPATQAA
jgi:FkbM family methyltransferase